MSSKRKKVSVKKEKTQRRKRNKPQPPPPPPPDGDDQRTIIDIDDIPALEEASLPPPLPVVDLVDQKVGNDPVPTYLQNESTVFQQWFMIMVRANRDNVNGRLADILGEHFTKTFVHDLISIFVDYIGFDRASSLIPMFPSLAYQHIKAMDKKMFTERDGLIVTSTLIQVPELGETDGKGDKEIELETCHFKHSYCDDLPAIFRIDMKTGIPYDVRYIINGMYHRDAMDQPAIWSIDNATGATKTVYMKHGSCHRLPNDGPAYRFKSKDERQSVCIYAMNGKIAPAPQPIDPSIEIVSGVRLKVIIKGYFNASGQLHRGEIAGPALSVNHTDTIDNEQMSDSYYQYAFNGKPHRKGRKDGGVAVYVNGVKYYFDSGTMTTSMGITEQGVTDENVKKITKLTPYYHIMTHWCNVAYSGKSLLDPHELELLNNAFGSV